ncbi:MAG: hypothetical protein ABIQ74_08720, partial [Chitinophagales bacterium]
MILLLAGLVIALQFPATQNYITQKAIHFISDKTHTKVTLGGINVAFPKSVVLKDLFLEDQQHDTLLYSHRFAVDIDMMKLFSHHIELNAIDVENLTSHVSRSKADSSFNFDFLIKAFVKEPPADTTTQPGWKFSLSNIHLEKIFFTLDDDVAGSQMAFRIGNFKTHFKDFDLDSMKFDIENIDLVNTSASVIQTKTSPAPASENTSPEMPGYNVNVHGINLSAVSLLFQTPQQILDMKIGQASVVTHNMSIADQKIELEKAALSDSKIYFTINKIITTDTVAQKAKEAVTTTESLQPSWKVTLEDLDLKNNVMGFNNFNSPELSQGIDFNHLLISGIDADVNSISYDEKNITADIRELKMRDQSGFELKHFQAKITYDSTHAELAELDLQTANSQIRRYISVTYPSIDAIADNIGDLKINADFEHTVIGLSDVLLLQPELAKSLQLKNPEFQSIRVNAKVNGVVKDIYISKMEVRAAGNTVLIMKGNIKGLPDAASAYYDISLQKFSTTNADVRSLINSSMLPSAIAIPAALTMKGYFKGYMKKFNGAADISSSFGNASAKVHMEKNEVYAATFSSDHLDLGKLLRDTTLGPVT